MKTHEIIDKMKALEAQVEALRTALYPFAKSARYIGPTADNGAPLVEFTKASRYIEAGDVRTARRVWEETRPKKSSNHVEAPENTEMEVQGAELTAFE